MGRIPTRTRSEERSRKHKALLPTPLRRRSSAKARIRKPGSIMPAILQTKQRLAVAQTKDLEPRRRETVPESRAKAEEDSWMSFIIVSPTHASPPQHPISPLILPDYSTLATPKKPPMSPSPWARSWVLYHHIQAQSTGQRSSHETAIDSGLKTLTLQPPETEQASQTTLFDVEWEAFEDDDCDYQDREPGWPRCPYCGIGHDPCLECFA